MISAAAVAATVYITLHVQLQSYNGWDTLYIVHVESMATSFVCVVYNANSPCYVKYCNYCKLHVTCFSVLIWLLDYTCWSSSGTQLEHFDMWGTGGGGRRGGVMPS